MAGRFTGVQKRITASEPRSIFVHCSNHCLDLALQEVARNCEVVGDALNIVKDVSHAILESKNRMTVYSNVVLPPDNDDANFDTSRLSAQLVLLPTLLRDQGPAASERILQILQGKSADMREMMDQVVRYLQLMFSVPASAASGERSFSALRRVKTFLRNRMTQRRLTHLLLLHVHKRRAADLQLDVIMKEFVSRTAERTATFGLL
ncbi:uncharacterized protein LOC144102594 [Amblyomma americanum]